jgi:hypothetical protein
MNLLMSQLSILNVPTTLPFFSKKICTQMAPKRSAEQVKIKYKKIQTTQNKPTLDMVTLTMCILKCSCIINRRMVCESSKT